ncbi:MAG: hypothetical protein UD936_00290 [Acutalibacteraceae bacterium]|nr:hypothetical protein [Acutalibacteraceae bacterium]
MGNFEYIKLFWSHNFDDEPVIILYEVNLDDDRFAKRSVDIFADREIKNINNLYDGAIEAVPVATVQDFNSGVFGKEFYACKITGEEFEKIWNSHFYTGDLYIEQEV